MSANEDESEDDFADKTQSDSENSPQSDLGNRTQSDIGNKTQSDIENKTQFEIKLPSATTSSGLKGITVAQGLGDTSNLNLAELAGASADAIRPLQGRFALCSKLGKGGMGKCLLRATAC